MAYREEEEEEEGNEVLDNEVDDNKKVYVSRLPYKWTEAQLAEHFQACFGAVKSASIKWDTKNDCSLGYGFIVFEKEDSRNAAIEQGSMHAKKKTIQIRAVEREETALGRGRDQGVCYLWQRSACVKGSDCIFLHEGSGACVKTSAFGEGKLKKCMSFKSKGKCSKGDSCPFLHVGKSVKPTHTKLDGRKEVEEIKNEERIRHCHTFQKNGKCRKGDSCKFSHSTNTVIINLENNTVTHDSKSFPGKKRKRIDGDELVKRMKAGVTVPCTAPI